MKKALLILLALVTAAHATAPASGQWRLSKRNANGTYEDFGLTAVNGQAIGFTGGAPTMLPLSSAAWGGITGTLSAQTDLQTALDARQPLDADLTAIAALASSAGLLTNNGIGTYSYTAKSIGGNGVADSGKIAVFDGGGGLNAAVMGAALFTTSPNVIPPFATLNTNGINFVTVTEFTLALTHGNPTANRDIQFPDASGTLLLSNGNGSLLTDLDASAVTSGTLPSARIGDASITLAKLSATGTPSSTTYLRGDNTWQAISGSGITIGTTTITGGTSGRVLYDNAGTVGELTTTGSGDVVRGTSPTITGLAPSSITGTAAILGANTFTAAQTITQASTNAGIFASTGYSLTGSNATNMLDFAGTWNTTGVPTSLKITLTETARGAGSNYLQILGGTAGTSNRFRIYNQSATASNDDVTTIMGGGSYAIGLRTGAIAGIMYVTRADIPTNNFIAFGFDGTSVGATMPSNGILSWSSSASSGGNYYLTGDVILSREAAATMQLGSDTNGDAVDQTFKAADGITGTDRSGGDVTISGGRGTGAGTASAVIISAPAAISTGTTAQTNAERMRVTAANVTFTALPKLPAYTVATLPSTAATGMVTGAMAYVTDATAPTYLTTLTGGGSVVCPVFYNGSAWVSH